MHDYRLSDPSDTASPALLVYPAVVRANLRRAVAAAGGAERLRPHVKTHKTRDIAAIELEMGIRKHKCATLAEAEMLAEAGAPDVLIAYPLVGPNAGRLARLAARHSRTRFGALVDHPDTLREPLRLCETQSSLDPSDPDTSLIMARRLMSLGPMRSRVCTDPDVSR